MTSIVAHDPLITPVLKWDIIAILGSDAAQSHELATRIAGMITGGTAIRFTDPIVEAVDALYLPATDSQTLEWTATIPEALRPGSPWTPAALYGRLCSFLLPDYCGPLITALRHTLEYAPTTYHPCFVISDAGLEPDFAAAIREWEEGAFNVLWLEYNNPYHRAAPSQSFALRGSAEEAAAAFRLSLL